MRDPIGRSLGAGFGVVSRLRGRRRSLHPDGVGFAATLTPAPDAPEVELLAGGPREGVARLSRALGTPEPLPDVLGLAMRFPDAYGTGRHQDLLLATTGRGRGVRHLFAPARGFLEPTYSSLLPFRMGDELVTIAAFPESSDGTPRVSLDDLRGRDDADLAFALAVAPPRGHWRTVAQLTLGARLEPDEVEELRFDAANSGGGLELAALEHLRHDAYRGSQRARH